MEGALDLTLQAVTVESGTIETGKPQIISVGDEIKSFVTISLNNDTFLNNDAAVITYSSNRASVANVDNNGIVTAVGEGAVTITATVSYKGVTMSNDFALKVMPEEVSISATEQIVSGYAANVAVTVNSGSVSRVELFGVNAPVADGKAIINLTATDVPAVLEDSVYKVTAFDGENAVATCDITVVPRNDNIWTVQIDDIVESKTGFVFAAEILPGPKGYNVKLAGASYTPVQDGNKLVIDYTAKDGDIFTIAGVKYPKLFPSYSFTFTITK